MKASLPLLIAALVPPAIAAAAVPASAAGLPVFDTANYAQNLLSAARALEQIKHQIASLQNEATMIRQQARQLETLDFSALTELEANFREIDRLVGQARAVGFQADRIEDRMEAMFPREGSGAVPRTDRLAAARARLDAARGALRGSIAMQAQVAENLRADGKLIVELVARSQAATGGLQAQQAANQLLALAAQQQLQLQAMLASQQRADALADASDLQAGIEGRAATRRFLGDGKAYTPR